VTTPHLALTRPIEYDSLRRRLWILGQRCHHGATGAMLTGGALVGAGAGRLALREGAALAGAGTLLMAHDWKDRSLWFERGRGTQP
jgi:hypothetical protein